MAERENYICNTNKRLFYLSDNVDKTTIGKVCFNLLYLLQEDDETDKKEKDFKREPIKIYVNSFGGSVYDMWALIDIMLNSKTPIYTYCTGYAMSAGFQIFLAGEKRYVSKNATLLYHQLSMWTGGKYLDVCNVMQERERNQKDIEKYIMSRTNISQEKLNEVREKKIDWYIHSEDCEKLGIAEIMN